MLDAPIHELQERLESLFKLGKECENHAFFKAFADIVEEAELSQKKLDFDVDIIVKVYSHNLRPLEYVLDVAEYLIYIKPNLSLDNILMHPTILHHIIKHLHRDFIDKILRKTFWSWIVIHAKNVPKLFEKILLEHSDNLDFTSKMSYPLLSKGHISYLDALLIKSPEMLPIVIQTMGSENIGLENIAILRTRKVHRFRAPIQDECKAFIDFTIKNKEFGLLKNALLQEENGILVDKLSVDYLLDNHAAILFYIIMQLGISQVEEHFGIHVDFSSPKVLEKLLTKKHFKIEENSEFFNVVKAAIQKEPHCFINVSMDLLSNTNKDKNALKDTVSKIIQFALTLDLDVQYWNNGKIVSWLKHYPDLERIKAKIQLPTIFFHLEFGSCWGYDGDKNNLEYIWEWFLTQPDNIELFAHCHFPHQDELHNVKKILKRYNDEITHQNIRKLLAEAIAFCKFFYENKYCSVVLNIKTEALEELLASFSLENKKIFLNWQAEELSIKPLVHALEHYDDDFTLMLLENGADPAEILNFELDNKADELQIRKKALKEKLIHILARIGNQEAMIESFSNEAFFKRILASSIESGPHQKEDQNIILQNLVGGHYYADSQQKDEVCLGQVVLATNSPGPLSEIAKKRTWQLIVLYALELNEHTIFNRYTEMLTGRKGMEGIFSAKSKDALLFQLCDKLEKLYLGEEHKTLIFSKPLTLQQDMHVEYEHCKNTKNNSSPRKK